MLGGEQRMLRVELIGRRDPHGLDVRVLAQCLDTVVGSPAVALLERLQRLGPEVRAGDELDLRHRLENRKVLGAPEAQAGDSDPKWLSISGHPSTPSP